jgi:hypothetical protein
MKNQAFPPYACIARWLRSRRSVFHIYTGKETPMAQLVSETDLIVELPPTNHAGEDPFEPLSVGIMADRAAAMAV